MRRSELIRMKLEELELKILDSVEWSVGHVQLQAFLPEARKWKL